MKIDNLPVKEGKPDERIEYVQKQQQEYRLIGRARKTPGHTLFSFNRKTKEIKVVKVDEVCAPFQKGGAAVKEKVSVEPDCFYGQALNRKNFIKRLKKLGMLY